MAHSYHHKTYSSGDQSGEQGEGPDYDPSDAFSRGHDDDSEFNRLYDQHFFTNSYYDNHFDYDRDAGLDVPAPDVKKTSFPSENSDHTDFSFDDKPVAEYIDHQQHPEFFVDPYRGPPPAEAPFVPAHGFIPIVPDHLAETWQDLSSDSEIVAVKRKLSGKRPPFAAKKDSLMPKPIRQSSASSIPTKAKLKAIRPGLNKSYSFTPDSKPNFLKQKPNFHLNLDQPQFMFRVNDTNASTSSFDETYNRLQIVENDLDFGADKEFADPQRIVTPSMKPPGAEQGDYFEHMLMPSNFDTLSDPSDKNNDPDNDPQPYEFYDPIDTTVKDSANASLPSRSNSPHRSFEAKQSPSSGDLSPVPFTQENAPIEFKPKLRRTTSNQSASSMNSLNSGPSSSGYLKKKKSSKGASCSICGKYISRDLSRHIRIHDNVGRFRCVYPKDACSHKTGNFNRPYDYKKHLLHFHFAFDDPKGKTANNLTDKLPLIGNCKACGFRATANEWLENHVLTVEDAKKCPFIDKKYAL